MHFTISTALEELALYIQPFIDLTGQERWFRRADQLDKQQQQSPNLWKIVADYHWLELAISFQAGILKQHGSLRPELVDSLVLTALNFAATTVEVHRRLSDKAKLTLIGRLRDALKAETGFAPLYLELDLAQRLMNDGYDVSLPDMEGTAQFDLLFRRDGFAAEVECKSLSADAGRQIHRKDFYRFMEIIGPALTDHRALRRREVLLITLDGRLSPNIADQAELVSSARVMLASNAPVHLRRSTFAIHRHAFELVLGSAPFHNPKAFYKACDKAFGPNTHLAGALTGDGGCIVVMRSLREDDTSKPMLDAMRKAADQFSKQRPAFIAIQDHGIVASDLMLPHLRRRAEILFSALVGHYGADHVNAICITGFGTVVLKEGFLGIPAFTLANPAPRFPAAAEEASTFLGALSDGDYAAAIGVPWPADEPPS